MPPCTCTPIEAMVDPGFGAPALDHRDHQVDEGLVALAHLGVRMVVRASCGGATT
jgi:hypothetical protein